MNINRVLQFCLLSILICGHGWAGVVLSDSTFNDANWTALMIEDQTPGLTGSFSGGQVASGGNPGSYRAVSNSGSNGHVFVAHLFNTLYNPATQGAITSLNFSFDVSFPDAGLAKPPLPVNFGFGLLQGGAYFLRLGSGVFALSTGWVTDSESGLQQANITKITNTSIKPDFSATGAPIQFGFSADFFSPIPCASPCATGAIDNWSVTINPAADTPEPGPLAMLIAPLCWIAFRARRRRSA
jgi:hypothetical protein